MLDPTIEMGQKMPGEFEATFSPNPYAARREEGLGALMSEATALKLPSTGRIVHYVLREGRNAGEHRPAIITKVWGDPAVQDVHVQLQVFTDATNDFPTGLGSNGLLWATSVMQDEESQALGTWHWPERVRA